MNRREFLRGGLAGLFGAVLAWAGLVKAEEPEPYIDVRRGDVGMGIIDNLGINITTDNITGMWDVLTHRPYVELEPEVDGLGGYLLPPAVSDALHRWFKECEQGNAYPLILDDGRNPFVYDEWTG